MVIVYLVKRSTWSDVIVEKIKMWSTAFKTHFHAKRFVIKHFVVVRTNVKIDAMKVLV